MMTRQHLLRASREIHRQHLSRISIGRIELEIEERRTPSMAKANLKVIVIGAGTGGLCLAHGLRAARHRGPHLRTRLRSRGQAFRDD